MIYFAYGSNLDPDQMAARCPGHEVLGRAVLADHRLCFPRRSPVRLCSTAGIAPAPGAEVWGALYRLEPDDVVTLNRREGYDPHGAEAANRYVLQPVTVQTASGPVSAFTYVAVPDGTVELPSADYLAHLLAGARHHGLPAPYLAALAAVPTAAS